MGKKNLANSFGYAIAGILYSIFNERNMKIHILAGILVVVLGFLLGISHIEWGLLFITIFMVLVAETINTAVEKAVDLVTTHYHPLAKTAKNLAAGAVLLSAINAVIMGFIIFGPYFSK